MLERVQKILAGAGVDSRRNCEELIAEGRVFVNGKKVKLGDKADAGKDTITVNGKVVRLEKKVYLLLFKPKNCISSVYDDLGRKTVIDLVDVNEKIFPVGRLDRDARGLVLLTNDGEVANRIMHPKYGVEKTYVVVVRERLNDDDIPKLKKGVFIEGRKVMPSNVAVINKNCVEISLHEGRKHIVKRMFFKLGYFVTDLKRITIANLSLKGLKEREFRHLSVGELHELRKTIGLS